VSEQGDQWKDREEPQQHGSESPNPSQGGGSEGGTGGSESGTERESGGQEGTEQGGGNQSGDQDEQPRQGDVEHEGDLGREPGGTEDSQGE